MSEETHTPGPWVVGYGDGISGTRAAYSLKTMRQIVTGPRQRLICCIPAMEPSDQEIAEIEADARLIAAAPDLLEALHGVLRLIGDGQLVRNTSNDANPDWAMRQLPFLMALKKATEAIEKAEDVARIGEAQTVNEAEKSART